MSRYRTSCLELHRLVSNRLSGHHRALPASYHGLQFRSISQKTSLTGISQDSADRLSGGIPKLYVGTFPFFSGINLVIYIQSDFFSSIAGCTAGVIVNSLLYGSVLYGVKRMTTMATSVSVTEQGQLEITTISMTGRHIKTTHDLACCNITLFDNVLRTPDGRKYYIAWNIMDTEDGTWNEFEAFDKYLTHVKYINPSADVKLCKDFGRIEGESDDIIKEIKFRPVLENEIKQNEDSQSWG